MTLYVLTVLLFIFCSIVDTRAEQVPSLDQDNILDGLQQTFSAFDKLMLFFEQRVVNINLDGIYGLRVAQGAFKASLSEHNEAFWDGIPEGNHTRKQLVDFVKRTGLVCDQAQSSIEEQGETYFNKFKDVVDKPWPFFATFGKRKLPNTMPLSTNRADNRAVIHEWDERTSDSCMSEVLGSNDKHTKCLFSEKCMAAITDMHHVGYGLTHHILFFTLAIINKCERKYSEILLRRVGVDVDGLVQRNCLSILAEMLELEDKGVPEDEEDLYLEQGFVCGMHGYEEFLSLDRLKRVLGRQLYPGCFGNSSQDRDDEDMEEESRSSRDNRGRHGNLESYRSMRRLLVDVTLEYGCSSHESGVAAGFLGIYTKWLLTKLEPTITSVVWTELSTLDTTPLLQLSITSQKEQGTAHGAEHKENNIYTISVIVSFVTTILTLVLVLALYKLFIACCRDHNGNKYRKVTAFSDDKDVI